MLCQNPQWLCAGLVCAVLCFSVFSFLGCDGQVLLHRCSSSVSNQLGFFKEWRGRGRRQPVVVHSVILSCGVFHGVICTSLFKSFLKECGNSKTRGLRLMVLALFSNSKPSLSRRLTKPNSEEHSPVCPPSNVPLKPQRSFAVERGQHLLEITGISRLTACQSQTLW
ncbi:hypothetical protein AMECASPLE_032299 [Ameca splendens]|uniref:Secreted protein n=1 Tax=Ameca splendens TaxID=208324 RepID=A0ABV0Z4G9_9TELE